MIVDASVVLMAFLSDEESHLEAQALLYTHASGVVHLDAPDLIRHEIANTLVKAVSRNRISEQTALEVIETFESLGISFHVVSIPDAFKLASLYSRSAYDAAYLALAELLDTELVTGDRRLYNAIQTRFKRIIWIGDYHPPEA